MKRVLKSGEPGRLAAYRADNPAGTWEAMREESADTYHECRAQSVMDQHGLCAYCESKISVEAPLNCAIEHFHPKSDKADASANWGLDWQNMLAVCRGGERDDKIKHPLPANLSCDAHKNHVGMKGAPAEILNPLKLLAFPSYFIFDKATCRLKPNESQDAPNDVELARRTIAILNLNCSRLVERRHLLFVDVEKKKRTLRVKYKKSAREAQLELCWYYFSEKWPEFFTTIRSCLGEAAEEHLRSSGYQG